MEHNDENLNQLCRKFQDKLRDLEVIEIQSDDWINLLYLKKNPLIRQPRS